MDDASRTSRKRFEEKRYDTSASFADLPILSTETTICFTVTLYIIKNAATPNTIAMKPLCERML